MKEIDIILMHLKLDAIMSALNVSVDEVNPKGKYYISREGDSYILGYYDSLLEAKIVYSHIDNAAEKGYHIYRKHSDCGFFVVE